MSKGKAYREGYEPRPFAFRQIYSEGTRVAAWTADLGQLRRLLLAVLDEFPGDVEILFKTKTGAEEDDWQRYVGGVRKSALIDLLGPCEELVLSDGRSMLCVRRPDTREYLARDEHGILFLYLEGPRCLELCEQLGFENRVEEPIFAAPHWHVRPKAAEQME